MMKKFFPFIVIVIFLLPLLSYSQTKKFQENSYKIIDGKWHLLSDTSLRPFPLVDKTISLKFSSEISENEKSIFELENNLIFLRKALTGWHDYQISENSDVFNVAQQFLNSSLVEKLEIPTQGFYTLVPDDTTYGNQYYLNQANGININVENAWDITTGDSSVTVAVLDSGTEWDHQDLGFGADSYQNIFLNSGEDAWANPNDPSTGNGIDDDGNGLIDDWKGWNFSDGYNDARQDPSGNTYFHGTHVAGIVAGKTNNAEGMAGVAGGFNNEGIKILTCAVGILGPNGAVLDDAILYAAQTGAKVVQLSLSVGQSSALDDAIDMAHDVFGVVVINASGNNGSSTGVGYPASHEKVLAIGATTSTDSRAGFSNHGPDLFMSAPGTGIWSTQLNGQYGYSDGTSFASPIVSGVVGLMFSVNPSLTPDEVKQILIDSSQKVGGYNYNWNTNDPGHSRELGYGRVDAFQAVLLANPSDGTCSLTSITTTNISACNDNGTTTDPSDDTFSVDVTVTFNDAPTTGTLDLTGDGTASVSVTGLTSPHTFVGVIMDADGGPINAITTFSAEPTCTLTIVNAGTAPDSCSTPPICSISEIAASNISLCDDNGTTSEPGDDTFTVDITITFSEAPTTGTLDLTGDGTATVDVTGITSPYTYEGVTMTADGSAIDVTATFSASTGCTLNNTTAGTAAAPCSILGLEDNVIETIAIYPNPAGQNITLLNILEERLATIYNLLGQQVIKQKVDINTNTINVSSLSIGTYVLKIEGYDQVLKFVKH